MDTIQEPTRGVPVIAEYDVVICGGGPAGCSAAIASARNGAKTLLVEKDGYLGGATVSQLVLVILSTNGVDFQGIWHEHMSRLRSLNAVRFEKHWNHPDFVTKHSGFRGSVDPERVKFVWDDLVSEAGTEQLLHCYAANPIIEENSGRKTIQGVFVETIASRQAILAKRIVDATADGIVCAQAGVPWEQGDGTNPWAMSCTKVYRIGGVEWPDTWPTEDGVEKLRADIVAAVDRGEYDAPVVTEVNRLVNYVRGKNWRLPEQRPEMMSVLSRVLRVDTLDPFDITRAEREGREQARQGADVFGRFVPGQEKSYLLDTSARLGVRSSRRIKGIATVTNKDAVRLCKHPDGIARGSFGIDVWPADSYRKQAGDEGGSNAFSLIGVTREERAAQIADGEYYDIRYGTLVAQGVDGLMMAGRCISADHFAESSLRIQQTCMATGEAAGLAAALSIQHDKTPRELDAGIVIEKLNQSRAATRPAFEELDGIASFM